MKKIVLVILGLVVLAGCGSSNKGVATGGSTSVEPIMKKMIDDYNAENPDKSPITYDATGSTAGVENTTNGSYDIGTASREVKDEEKGTQLKVDVIAYDGIAVIVNPENKVGDLSIEQIKKIYTGEIKNWKEVGGADQDIAVISRDSASGTRSAFEEIVDFEGKLVSSSLESSSNGEVLTNVGQNKYAIGYASFDYLDDTIKAIKVDGVEPTPKNVIDKLYNISRPFNMMIKNDATNENAKAFYDWVLKNKDSYVKNEGLIGA